MAGHLSTVPSVFDQIVGYLEDIMISEEFQETQGRFINDNCETFEETDENKLCYTIIHNKYITMIENLLDRELKKRMAKFSMEDFMSDLQKHKNELDGEVFEMLYTLTDFVLFKEMMLDYKKAKTGDAVSLELTNSYFSCPATRANPMLLLNQNSGDKLGPTSMPNGAELHTENGNLGSSLVTQLLSLDLDASANLVLPDALSSTDDVQNSGISTSGLETNK